ncbi:MAG TPA: TonB-dependent receptor [Vicinamibacterales bacterium]|nr:TonB-dependent receptor [Vicinamibacterales bacterium]
MRKLVTLFCCTWLWAATAYAQAPATATLQVTVLDETRGVLPGASVTLARIDAADKAAEIGPTPASQQGQVKFENLVPGRYAIKAEFSGFQTRTLPDVRIRSGENKQVVVLQIDRVLSSVTVERDKQAAASDRDVTFGTVLTREQIDALSDDPDELRRQLQDIAGPGATILVDSFEGRDLPPKALIKSIRVTRDQFAPEVHFAGELRIEILTQPGIGPVRGNVRSGFYDSLMDGENPLIDQTGPAQSWMYGIGLSGTLVSERASFNVNFNGQDSYSTPVVYAATPGGPLAGNVPARSPNDNYFFNGGLDYALTRDQVLRLHLQGSKFSTGNIGVGSYDLPGRAYSTEDSRFGLFLQQNGPLGRRFVLNTRMSIFGGDSEASSALEEMTVLVTDAFNSGGAQRTGGTHARNYWFNSDLDYVRGIHSMRTGIDVQVATYETNSNSNYLGTYVFANLDAFNARTPRSYTRRIGDPALSYSNVQGGVYFQDDIKIRKNFTVTGGVRYEAQTHVPDALNLAPRAGFTWAPFKGGKTTLRGSWGMFYDWLPTNTYLQTLQVDGVRQREVNIVNPTFPDPGDVGTAPPTNRYILAEERDMAYSQRLSAGIAQTISRRVTTNVLYSYAYRYSLLTGRNINTPVNGVRPDPDFANVVLATSAGHGRQHTVNASANVNLGPMAPTGGPAAGGGGPIMIAGDRGPMMIMMGPGGPAATTGPRWQWNRGLTMSGFYSYGQNYDNTDGAFVIPASLILANEWGPAAFDRRHQTNFAITSTALRNLTARLSVFGQSAPPITVRSGTDDNGDLVFNDRPDGVGRNSERTMSMWNTSLNFGYSFTLGKKTVTSTGGVQIMGSPAGLTVNPTGAQTTPRYRLNIGVNVNNVFNQAAYSGFGSILTSQFFLKPTVAGGLRRITFNTNVSF